MTEWILTILAVAVAIVGVAVTVFAVSRRDSIEEPLLSSAQVAQWIRRVVVTVVGSTILLIGLVFLLLPGPGVLTCVAGLAILSIEFKWPRKLLYRARRALAVFRQPDESATGPDAASASSEFGRKQGR